MPPPRSQLATPLAERSCSRLAGGQLFAVGGEHAAAHVKPRGLQVACQLERLDHAKVLLDLTGGLIYASIRIGHQGLELPVVLLQQCIDHGNDGQDQEPCDQKDLPVGNDKAQGHQAQQGAAAGGVSATTYSISPAPCQGHY
jgi:hypothetical protein